MVPETTHTRALRLGLAFRICGTLILLVGIGSLVLGPVEMVCFTWFEAGGRFAYDGFGFGSFMFGNIAMQILGYYLIAAVLIPLGYGHLTLRRWVPSVTLALVWCWVVFGVPLLIVLLFILLATKELSVGAGTAAAFLAVLSYAALPGLLIRLYRSRRAQAAFGIPGPHPDVFSRWVESQSVPAVFQRAFPASRGLGDRSSGLCARGCRDPWPAGHWVGDRAAAQLGMVGVAHLLRCYVGLVGNDPGIDQLAGAT